MKGQKGTCVICDHPQRAEIDTALLAGESSRNLAARYGFSNKTFLNHRTDCLKMALARVRSPESIVSDLFADLEGLRQRTLDLLAQAEQSGNAAATVALIREARANVCAISTLLNSVKSGPVREAEPTDQMSDEEIEHAVLEIYQRQMRFAGEEIEEAEGMPVQSIADWGTP